MRDDGSEVLEMPLLTARSCRGRSGLVARDLAGLQT